MAGTLAGGAKARDKNLARDPDFYKKIGAKGGRNSDTGGFATKAIGKDGMTGPERASVAGYKGGVISRRNRG